MVDVIDNCRIVDETVNTVYLDIYIKQKYGQILTIDDRNYLINVIDSDRNGIIDIYEFRDFFASWCKKPDIRYEFT